LVAGLMAAVTGMFNGGETCALGLANTLASVAKVAAGVAIANRTDLTDNLPLIGKK